MSANYKFMGQGAVCLDLDGGNHRGAFSLYMPRLQESYQKYWLNILRQKKRKQEKEKWKEEQKLAGFNIYVDGA